MHVTYNEWILIDTTEYLHLILSKVQIKSSLKSSHHVLFMALILTRNLSRKTSGGFSKIADIHV